MKKEDILG